MSSSSSLSTSTMAAHLNSIATEALTLGLTPEQENALMARITHAQQYVGVFTRSASSPPLERCIGWNHDNKQCQWTRMDLARRQLAPLNGDGHCPFHASDAHQPRCTGQNRKGLRCGWTSSALVFNGHGPLNDEGLCHFHVQQLQPGSPQ